MWHQMIILLPAQLPKGHSSKRAPPRLLPPPCLRRSQGILGGDFPCPGSVQPGACALPSVTDALFLCFVSQPACKALVVYSNGAVAERRGGSGAASRGPGTCCARKRADAKLAGKGAPPPLPNLNPRRHGRQWPS